MKNIKLKKRLLCGASALTVAVSGIMLLPSCVLGKEVTVVLNGEELDFDVEPRVVSGTALVPMRKMLEELGMTVSWNSGNATVTAVKNGKSIVSQVGNSTITVNGEAVEVSAAPVLEDGVVLIPLSIISEALDADVDWDENSGIVTITKKQSESDEGWKENEGAIDLSSMTVSGDGSYVDGKIITITAGGDFTVSGTSADAMIYVNTEDRVKLRLSGVNLTNTTGPAIFFENSDKGYITLSSGTENVLTDGEVYDVDAKGAIFSNDDLEIKGGGKLTVNANYNHGIASDDGIEIEEGEIVINAVNDGIHANDCVTVSGGKLTVTATGDGIQSEGYVKIEGGSLNIVTDGEVSSSFGEFGMGGGMGKFHGEKGVRAGIYLPDAADSSDASFPNEDMPAPPNGEFGGTPPDGGFGGDMGGFGGEMNNEAGGMDGGPGVTPPDASAADDSASSKGIKAETNLIISGGEITVDSADHCLHSAGTVFVNGGVMTLTSEKKKGISAHAAVVVEDGKIDILKSTEGIESKGMFCINGGSICVVSSDDGLNAGGTGGQDDRTGSDEHSLYINGGSLYVNASGDGLDANGNIYVNGGTIVVSGPTDSGNGSLDSGNKILVNGGTMIASGSSGMAEYPDGDSAQSGICYAAASVQQAGTIVRIEDSNGNELITYRNPKAFQSVFYTSAALELGGVYNVYLGGTYVGGADENGVLSGGTYSGGVLAEAVTLSSNVTYAGSASAGMGMGMGMGGGRGGQGGMRR